MPVGSNSFCAASMFSRSMSSPRPALVGPPRDSFSRPTLREREQRVVDAPIDLQALALASRALAVRALAGNADLVDAILPRRRLDGRDLGGQRAAIVLQRNEQIGLERDEEVPDGL